jgi:hypothetical protein
MRKCEGRGLRSAIVRSMSGGVGLVFVAAIASLAAARPAAAECVCCEQIEQEMHSINQRAGLPGNDVATACRSAAAQIESYHRIIGLLESPGCGVEEPERRLARMKEKLKPLQAVYDRGCH